MCPGIPIPENVATKFIIIHIGGGVAFVPALCVVQRKKNGAKLKRVQKSTMYLKENASFLSSVKNTWLLKIKAIKKLKDFCFVCQLDNCGF